MKLRRALFLTPEAPYPLASGGSLRTASILCFLAKHFAVEMIVFKNPAVKRTGEMPAGLVQKVTEIDLPPQDNSFHQRIWRTISRLYRGVSPHCDRFAGHESAIAAAADGMYDVVVIEHFHCANYIHALRPFSKTIVCDLHNIESAWHESNAKSSTFFQSIVQRIFSKNCVRLEEQLLPLFDLLLVTSDEDKVRCKVDVPIHIVPNAIPKYSIPDVMEEDVISFSGTMDYEPNKLAIRWFINEVWPSLSSSFPTLRFRIIGRNPEFIHDIIKDSPRVEVTGAIPDSVAELAKSSLVVVPLLSGSGTRLKIIEAWAAAKAVVSTPIGAEGLPVAVGGNIAIESDPAAFASEVHRLLKSPEDRQKMGNLGRKTFEEKLTWEKAWSDLEEAFEKLKLLPREQGAS
jgi:polysaccharide biosynthesis protein PslH